MDLPKPLEQNGDAHLKIRLESETTHDDKTMFMPLTHRRFQSRRLCL